MASIKKRKLTNIIEKLEGIASVEANAGPKCHQRGKNNPLQNMGQRQVRYVRIVHGNFKN